jgi:hypothetical protein
LGIVHTDLVSSDREETIVRGSDLASEADGQSLLPKGLHKLVERSGRRRTNRISTGNGQEEKRKDQKEAPHGYPAKL